jgi:hypothetical protein
VRASAPLHASAWKKHDADEKKATAYVAPDSQAPKARNILFRGSAPGSRYSREGLKARSKIIMDGLSANSLLFLSTRRCPRLVWHGLRSTAIKVFFICFSEHCSAAKKCVYESRGSAHSPGPVSRQKPQLAGFYQVYLQESELLAKTLPPCATGPVLISGKSLHFDASLSPRLSSLLCQFAAVFYPKHSVTMLKPLQRRWPALARRFEEIHQGFLSTFWV